MENVSENLQCTIDYIKSQIKRGFIKTTDIRTQLTSFQQEVSKRFLKELLAEDIPIDKIISPQQNKYLILSALGFNTTPEDEDFYIWFINEHHKSINLVMETAFEQVKGEKDEV